MTNKLTLIFKMIDTSSLKLDLLIKKKMALNISKTFPTPTTQGEAAHPWHKNQSLLLIVPVRCPT